MSSVLVFFEPLQGLLTKLIETHELKRMHKWLHDGAKPTDTVHNILSREGILKKFDEQKNAK